MRLLGDLLGESHMWQMNKQSEEGGFVSFGFCHACVTDSSANIAQSTR